MSGGWGTLGIALPSALHSTSEVHLQSITTCYSLSIEHKSEIGPEQSKHLKLKGRSRTGTPKTDKVSLTSRLIWSLYKLLVVDEIDLLLPKSIFFI